MSVETRRPSDDARGLRFRLVAAQWNERVVARLADGALATLRAQGAADADLSLWWVPGALELPLAAKWAAAEPFAAGAPDAVIALGCVIRGETEHFAIVARNAAGGLARVALETGVPVANGVLAVYDAAQADSRSGGEHGNAGSQAALAAIRMARLRPAAGGAR